MAKKEKSGVKKIKKLIKEMEGLRERELKRLSDEIERRLNEFRELQQNILERVGIASDKDSSEASTGKSPAKRSDPGTSVASAKAGAAAKSPKKTANSKQAAKKQTTTTKSSSSKSGRASSAKQTDSVGKTGAKSSNSPVGKTEKSGATSKAGTGRKNDGKNSTTEKSQTAKPAKAQKSVRTSAPKQAKAATGNELTRIKGVGPATAEKMRAIGITSLTQIATPSDADHKKLQEFSRMRGFSTWQAEAKKLLD